MACVALVFLLAACSTTRPWLNSPLDATNVSTAPIAASGRDSGVLVAVTLSEQMRTVADVLAAAPAPLPLAGIEAAFKGRGGWKNGLPRILETLKAVGRARNEAAVLAHSAGVTAMGNPTAADPARWRAL